MNLEEAIQWYNENKKKEDEKVRLIASNQTKTGQMRKSVFGREISACTYCGRGVPEYELDRRNGYCATCEKNWELKRREAEELRFREVRSGYRGAVRAQYVETKLDWPSVSVPPMTATMGNWDFPYIAPTVDKTAELERKIVELKAEIERLAGTGIEASGSNDVIITGRKFRKKEEEAADELCDHRGPEAK